MENEPTYGAAGVSLATAGAVVERLRAAVESTGAEGFGAVAGLYPLDERRLLAASMDSIGTKPIVARARGLLRNCGADMAAHCINDVATTGAEPLFLLDYVAADRLDLEQVAELVEGAAEVCRAAGCALVGGETAEHPGLLEEGTFDLAGTCLGIVERGDLLDGTAARDGDVIFGLPSSGLHSNGYSLVRTLLAQYGIPLERPYQEQLAMTLGDAGRDEALAAEPELAMQTVGDVLLTPTRIYALRLLEARRALRASGHDLRGLAHITGGGLPGNAPRALPQELAARLDPDRWSTPSVMTLVAALGGLAGEEVRATFNGGIGMVAVVDAGAAGALEAALPEAVLIGEVARADEVGRRYVEGPLRVAV